MEVRHVIRSARIHEAGGIGRRRTRRYDVDDRAARRLGDADTTRQSADGRVRIEVSDLQLFNAGMGGNAAPDLAIAVSNAGGLGAIGTGPAMPAEIVRERVARVRSGTKGVFAINYLLAFEPVTLSVALDAGAPIVQFAWGNPPRRHGRSNPQGQGKDRRSVRIV